MPALLKARRIRYYSVPRVIVRHESREPLSGHVLTVTHISPMCCALPQRAFSDMGAVSERFGDEEPKLSVPHPFV